ncbi:EAL domain-containing protein [Methylococcus sp. EFPC2]|uniref:EAL domain-containing protein n=1 Tax=Methylococcus sp. EFPC2 TaxID=2812648 RepID=UPI0019673A73|nr:EAL domain-containing protein [Methylococcus sp. EFPC2]QSA96583.1 EAL domain-containing protein [Methylococcus sp. EFPC2]
MSLRPSWSRWPLRLTLPLLMSAAMLAGIASSLYLTHQQYRRELASQVTAQAREASARFARQAERALPQHNTDDLEREIMLHAAQRSGVDLAALVSPDGTVLFAQRVDWKNRAIGDVRPSWNVARFARTVHGALVNEQWQGDGTRLSVLMPYNHPPDAGELVSRRRGAVVLEYDIHRELAEAAVSNLVRHAPSIATVVLLTLLQIGWLNRHLARPLAELATTARRIGGGEFDVPSATGGAGEVALLGLALHDMAQRLAEMDAAQAHRVERFRQQNDIVARLVRHTTNLSDFAGFSRMMTEAASEFFAVARANVWLLREGDSLLYCIDHYDSPARSHTQGAVLQQKQFADEFAALQQATYIDADDAMSDPRLTGYRDGYLKPNRIVSMLDVVLRVGDRVIGVFCLEHVDTPHAWRPHEIAFACQLGALLTNVAEEEERRLSERLLAHQAGVLEMVASDRPLPDILDALARGFEAQSPGLLVSILLLSSDGVRLHHGAAPNLPADYTSAIDGIVIGPKVGSCGTAAYFVKPVAVEDIATDPLWADYCELALHHGLAACWSTPILDADARVLGTFAIYSRTPAFRQPPQQKLIDHYTHTAAIAIQRRRMAAELSAREAQMNRLFQAVEQSPESILITGAGERIEYVNDAFVKSSGYSRDEIIGRPLHFQAADGVADIHYDAMRQALRLGENWQGELSNHRRDGSERIDRAIAAPVRDEKGMISHYLLALQDITRLREAEARIERLAYFDALTGLPNRALVRDRLAKQLAAIRRDIRTQGLMVLDIDRFQTINDARGHARGDEVLRKFVERLVGLLAPGDVLARIGSDEFVLLLQSGDGQQAAHQAMTSAEKIHAGLRRPLQIGQDELVVGASIGITLFPEDDADTPDDILCRADTALHRAKGAGDSQSAFYESDMRTAAEQYFQVERELRTAVPAGELRLYLQPQVDSSGTRVGAEALLRWQHPRRGLLAPGTFIAVAEETGLIVELDRWVLTEVCRFLAGRDGVMSVNISPRHFRKADFAAWLKACLREHGISGSRITLELTEGVLIDNPNEIVAKMNDLAELGIRFAIDDFGTGYSSLAYLKRLPIHELKIDKTFVQDAPVDPDDAALVEAILAVAGHLRLKVVAEGVETAEQAAFLNSRAEVVLQGYLYGKPEPAECLGRLMEEDQR